MLSAIRSKATSYLAKNPQALLKNSLVSPLGQRGFAAKIFASPEEAIEDIPHGASIAFGGFGLCGLPENLITALAKKGTKDITCISNEAGDKGYGIDILLRNHQVKKIICSFVGNNTNLLQQYFNGEVELELMPQGSFAEKLRAGGAGIPAYFTKSGVGSIYSEGGMIQKFTPGGGAAEIVSMGKEMRIFDKQRYIMVHSIKSDYSFVKGHIADELGNVVFNKTALNFNIDVAKAGKKCIVEVEKVSLYLQSIKA